MPFVSRAQQRWGHTAAGEKALGGPAAVAEWDAATPKGKDVPQRVKQINKLRKRGMVSERSANKHLSKYGQDNIDASSR